jgi:hypothetical protein
MTKQKDPNSKRSQKRANRNFTMSRPERRAERRLSIALNGQRIALNSQGIDPGYRKPGAQKHW